MFIGTSIRLPRSKSAHLSRRGWSLVNPTIKTSSRATVRVFKRHTTGNLDFILSLAIPFGWGFGSLRGHNLLLRLRTRVRVPSGPLADNIGVPGPSSGRVTGSVPAGVVTPD